MIEIELHPFRAADQELHEGYGLLQQPSLCSAAIGAARLRLEVPVEVLAHRAYLHVDAKLHLDQIAHDSTVTQSKRQGSRRGRLRGQDREQHSFMQQRQGALRQVGPSPFTGNQTCITLSRVALRPSEHGGDVLAHDPGDLAPGKTQFQTQTHVLAAQGLECIAGKLSSVDLVHGQLTRCFGQSLPPK